MAWDDINVEPKKDEPLTPAQVTQNRVAAMNYQPVNFANPYGQYQDNLAGLLTQTTGSLAGDLDAINTRYTDLRNQVMNQYSDSGSTAIANARDLALAELSRQADDATRQVAANYEAAQARQAEFANNAQALGAELGQQNAALANVAAGNIAAYNDQFGVSDGASVDAARIYAAAAPRAQALAQALGLSAAGFENAMGTSIGEQQMALQGQIARDLANQSGALSSQTARDIAEAEIRNSELQRQAFNDMVLRQMAAEEAANERSDTRAFALQQALAEAGLQGGLFSVDQARYEAELQRQREQDALNRWAMEQDFAARQFEMDRTMGLDAIGEAQRILDNDFASQANDRANRELALREAELNVADEPFSVPPQGRVVSNFVREKNRGSMAQRDADVLEMMAANVGQGLNTEDAMALSGLWSDLSPDTRKVLGEMNINSFSDFVNRVVYRPLSAEEQERIRQQNARSAVNAQPNMRLYNLRGG